MPGAARRERWLLLHVLEFTSDRKRMSVIVKDASSGRIRIYIKVRPQLPHISPTFPPHLPHISGRIRIYIKVRFGLRLRPCP